MSTTPDVHTDDPSRRRSRRWGWWRAGWIGRRRPGGAASTTTTTATARATNGPDAAVPRMLFLDDDPRRAATFLADHPEAVWVTEVPDCVARLAEPWDEVHLDHDLGGKTFVDSADVDCGMEVIRWLCKEPREHLKDVSFFVHTHNATAGLLMVLQMRCGGYKAEFRPFGLDLERLLAHNEPAPSAESATWPPEPSRGPRRRAKPGPGPQPTAPILRIAGWLRALGRSWRARVRSRKTTESP